MNSKALNNKGVSPLLTVILILALLSAIGCLYYFYIFRDLKNDNKLTEETKKVTETEIKNWECDNNLYKCETVSKINNIREANNLKKLEIDRELCEAARDLAFNHTIIYSEEMPRDVEWDYLRKPYFENLKKSFKFVGVYKWQPQKTLMKETVWPKWKNGENIDLYNEELVINKTSELPEKTTHICIAHPVEGRDFNYKGKDYSFFTPTTILFFGERK